MTDCHICRGVETLDSLILLQLGNAPVRVPLCQKHVDLCEGALAEIRKVQTPPVAVNCSAVTAGGRGGNG